MNNEVSFSLIFVINESDLEVLVEKVAATSLDWSSIAILKLCIEPQQTLCQIFETKSVLTSTLTLSIIITLIFFLLNVVSGVKTTRRYLKLLTTHYHVT